MNVAIIKNDKGVMYAQIGTGVKSRRALRKLCKKNGEEFVALVKIRSRDKYESQMIQALETIVVTNCEGIGYVIETMLLKMFQAGSAKK